MSDKLYIPGPVAVSPKTYRAMTAPLVGHRSREFVDLYHRIQGPLQTLFYTRDPVFLSTSSSWGVMEAAIRNLTTKGVLNCMSGAFSDRWHDVALKCGLPAGTLQFDWGVPLDPEAVGRELETGKYDAITLIHNETSTGTMNPLETLMAEVRRFPEVVSIVDTVSSFSALPIEKDALGIDVMLTGSQKALALPPGLSIFSVSQRALDRAATVGSRGFYFDFHEFLQNHRKGMTPSTPNIPLIYALESKLEDIYSEGLSARYQRHERLNSLVHLWVEANGFNLFPDRAYASKTLTCVRNTLGIDVLEFIRLLRENFNCIIDGGYGKLKGRTFRISNMGDESDKTINDLLHQLSETLRTLRS